MPTQTAAALDILLGEIRNCGICTRHLPLGPRPILAASAQARVLIIGQAPGTRVHESGIPWNDKSGDRLREWLEIEPDIFYDATRIAIVPMGFCYPGRDQKGGDKPPRPECAPEWHPKILPMLKRIRLTLLVGMYAQKARLGSSGKETMTETVRHWADYGPDVVPLPHPSWRTTGWERRNPWFGETLLPCLRRRVAQELAG